MPLRAASAPKVGGTRSARPPVQGIRALAGGPAAASMPPQDAARGQGGRGGLCPHPAAFRRCTTACSSQPHALRAVVVLVFRNPGKIHDHKYGWREAGPPVMFGCENVYDVSRMSGGLPITGVRS